MLNPVQVSAINMNTKKLKKRIEDLAPGGGFVFNQVHNIQAGVPPENIMAMYSTLKENWKY